MRNMNVNSSQAESITEVPHVKDRCTSSSIRGYGVKEVELLLAVDVSASVSSEAWPK